MSYYNPGGIDNPFFKIYITHLPTQKTVSFRGWVTEFSDQFTSNWRTESVYGRMDPLATFENTQRQLNIGFDVVSGDANEAAKQLAKINRLIEFLYPVYSGNALSDQNTLRASPLIGLRWSNLVGNPLNGQRLVGYLGGCTYAPDIAMGTFILDHGYSEYETRDAEGSSNEEPIYEYVETDYSGRSAVPKVVSISLNYTVIHTHLVGWSQDVGPQQPGQSGFTFADPEIDGRFPNAFYSGQKTTIVETTDETMTSDPTSVRTAETTAALDGGDP